MKKLFFLLCSIAFLSNPVLAFEDCVLSSDAQLTEIKVEDTNIIEVHSIYTIMNEKNMFLVQPHNLGKTKFSFLYDNKEKVTLDVEVKEGETVVDLVPGLELLPLDVLGQNNPFLNSEEEEFELDVPPTKLGGE